MIPKLSFRAEIQPELAGQPSELTLLVYDVIGETYEPDAITAKNVITMISQLQPSRIHLRINSIGGDVFDAIAIHSLLREQSAKGIPVEATVDGLAASAASLLVCAADVCRIPSAAAVMIHNPWQYSSGDADELEKQAGELRAIASAMADLYVASAARRGVTKTREDFLAAMTAETWLFGADAVAWGLATEVTQSESKIAASLDRKLFKNLPDALVGGLGSSVASSSPVEGFHSPLPQQEAPSPQALAEVQAALVSAQAEVSALRSELADVQAKHRADVETYERREVLAKLQAERRITPALAAFYGKQPLEALKLFALDAPVLAQFVNFEPPQASNVGEPTWNGKTWAQLTWREKTTLHNENPELFGAMAKS